LFTSLSTIASASGSVKGLRVESDPVGKKGGSDERLAIRMRVLVAGFGEGPQIYTVLDGLHQTYGLAEVIHGGRSELDQVVASWVSEQNLKSQVFPVEWVNHVPYSRGSNAVLRRDLLMLAAKPDLVLVFGAVDSTSVVGRAARAGIPIGVVGEGTTAIRTAGRGWGDLARRLAFRQPEPSAADVTSGIIEGAVVAFVRQAGAGG
jgi:hypothetical protein